MNKVIAPMILLVTLLFPGYKTFGQEHLSLYRKDGRYQLYNETKDKNLSDNISAGAIIQDALDHLKKTGGSITLSRGTYTLEQTLKLHDNIILSGQGRGTVLQGTIGMECLIAAENTSDASIKRLALSPGEMQVGSGICLSGISNMNIENIDAYNFEHNGIHVTGTCSDLQIYRCNLTGNGNAGIMVEQSGAGDSCLIKECMFLWGGSGIKTRNASGVSVRSSVLYHINGIPLDIHCNRYAQEGTRVFIGESHTAALAFTGNDFDIRYNIMGWVRGNGIVLSNAGNGLIRANNIIDLGPPPRDTIFKSGVVLRHTGHVDILANAIWNWDDWTQGPMLYGIDEGPQSDHNHIEHNNIHFYREAHIRTFNNNTVVRNNVYDPGIDDQRPLMDFSIWVDHVLGFINRHVSNTLPVEDHMEDYLVTASAAGYQVMTSVTGQLAFTSPDASEAIQWALDQSTAGGGIEIAAGTYPIHSTLTVPANIWLHGSEKTILRADEDMEQVLQLEGAFNTVVSGLTLVQGAGALTGIALKNSLLARIQDVTVRGFSKYGIHFMGDRENAPPETWGGSAGPALILVSGSKFIDNRLVNIHKPENGAYIGNAVPSMITGNITRGGETGILCEGICDNIVGNIVLQASKHAIVLDANSILCVNNMTYQTRGTAIKVFDGMVTYSEKYDRHDNNNNKESNVSGNYLIYQMGSGIEMSEQWGCMVDNIIVNSGAGVGHGYGIWLRENSESYAIVNNQIWNHVDQYPLLTGIVETGVKNLVAANTIRNYTGAAIHTSGDASLVTGNSGIASSKSQEGLAWQKDDLIDWQWTYPEIRSYLIQKHTK